jgi:hypothetical protein
VSASSLSREDVRRLKGDPVVSREVRHSGADLRQARIIADEGIDRGGWSHNPFDEERVRASQERWRAKGGVNVIVKESGRVRASIRLEDGAFLACDCASTEPNVVTAAIEREIVAYRRRRPRRQR